MPNVVPQTAKKRPKRKTQARCKVSRRRKPRAKRSSQADYVFDPQVEASARRKKRTKRPASCKPKRRRRRPRRPVPQPTPPPPSPPQAPVRFPSPVALYAGPFGRSQAERLLWRAGFGPSPGWPEMLAAMGVDAAVEALVSPPGPETFTGAEPRTSPTGSPLEPQDLFGHDHLFWLDRMVRTDQPLVQRMALIWHDWFATSNNDVGSQRLMLDQYELFGAPGAARSSSSCAR